MIVNSFQIPNQLVDEYLTELNGNELKILLVIIRKTKGWNKEFDGISISQFQKFTGIKNEKTVRKAIKKLIELGLIEKIDNAGKFSLYRLTPPPTNDGGQQMVGLPTNGRTPLPKNDPTPLPTNGRTPLPTNGRTPLPKNDPHKYTLPKDTNTKDTNTKESKKEKNIKKEKSLLEEVLEKAHIKSLMKNLNIDNNFLMELFYYREQIGKPLKTERAVSGLLKELLMCKLKTKKSAEEIFEIMEIQGWKSIKAEWIKNIEEEPVTSNNEESDNISEVQRALAMLNS